MSKVAFITGGSRGIGRAIARELAGEGYAVGINYLHSASEAQQLVDELVQQGCAAMAVQADVSDRAAITAPIRAVEREFGEIDVLVNNAGISQQDLFQYTDEALWRRLFAVNVDGAYNTIQAVLPAMIARQSGSIVNISSMWGLRGASCEVSYSATKAAIIGLTRSLAMELAPSHIRVNCVAPGVIRTDMVEKLGQETIDALTEETPLGRIGTPEDIAEAVAFLAGDKASFVTGQVLTADGGFIL